MSTAAIRHFDLLDYVEKSKSLGVDENIAKYQARQIEQAINIAVDTARTEVENKELATKKDMAELKAELKVEIQKSKFEMVAWVAGMFIASGLIQHFLK